MSFSSILLNMASNAGTSASGTANNGSMTIMIIILMVFMVAYMFFMSRKDKKQQQTEKDMRESLKIGDEVMTIGGIMGRVVAVKDDSVVIETGADRTKIRFTKQAIAKNVTADAKIAELKNSKAAAAKKNAEDKVKAKADKKKK